MARGNDAKELVINKIKEAFGDSFVGVFDKKVYVWSEEDGQKMQICLALTCPKTPVGDDSMVTIPRGDGGINFEDEVVAAAPSSATEISAEEQQKIADLMASLGL